MKILHVIASMDPKQGGVGQAVRTIIMGLAEHGVHNEVASLDAPAAAWAQADSFTTHTLGPGRGPWHYSAQLSPWLEANLSRFDAVVLHGLWLYQGYALRKALRNISTSKPANGAVRNTHPKLFVMPHGMLDPYFQQAAGRKLKAWRNWAYWKLLEASVVNGATGLLFTCETERLLAHEPFAPYRPQRELVVGLGVEEPPSYTPAMREAFLATCPGLRNRPYILFLSRIHEKKGVDLLLQAYAYIAGSQTKQVADASSDSLTSSGATVRESQEFPALVIAGPGLETSYGQRIRGLGAELTESAPVFFPGMLAGEAKWGAFYGCDAFVLPSHQENFGIAVVEALACSKPVLISNQVNIWREIEAAGGGMVAADTLDGTQLLLTHWSQLCEPEKQAFGERAQATYRKHFAVGPAAEQLVNALNT